MSATSERSFFDSIAVKHQEAYGHCKDRREFAQEAMNLLPPDAKVLDVGCGTGKPVASAVVDSGRRLHGIDFSPKMIEMCREQVPRGIFELVDILDYQPEAPFDAIISIHALFHFSPPQIEVVISKFRDWIKPRGYLFLGTLHTDPFQTEPHRPGTDDNGARYIQNWFLGYTGSILVYTELGWQQLLEKAGFRILNLKKETYEPPADSGSASSELHFYITAQREA